MDSKIIELKVGVFILIAIIIFFIIVFSIGDIYIMKPGYNINVIFSFASGITEAAPVRLSGVMVGQVKEVAIFYDEKDKKAKARVRAWLEDDAKIGADADATINTLGLLGEKYLEISSSGIEGQRLLKDGDTLIGRDPVPMEKITENLKTLSDDVNVIVGRLRRGEGTIGKLLAEDVVYDDIKSITGNFKDFSYDLKSTAGNFKEFSEDIKRHPWKLLNKPRGE